MSPFRCIAFSLWLLCTPAVAATTPASAACPIRDSTRVVYSTVNGVGSGSKIWIADFLEWWNTFDTNVEFVALSARDLQVHCDLQAFPNLRVYINPGGDAYMQLSSLGVAGTDNIKAFVHRDQRNPSAYVGICAGTYLAAHDYIWETMYQGADYYDFATNPPMSLFPHTVEGSIFDINDDQFGDQSGSKFRVVNVSNGHHMLYYGGSTFGYNGVPDYADPQSPEYDEDIEVLVYYTDFYGHNSFNIPGAWRYGNLLLSSVHPEASNCTDHEDVDCPPAGTLPMARIWQNWAWLSTYINEVSQSSFLIPTVPIAPIFDTTPPHKGYSHKACYDADESILFCDDFEADASGQVPYGLSPQFQRNESNYQYAHPWNTSFISSWNGHEYTTPFEGAGYAVVVPMSLVSQYAAIETKNIVFHGVCEVPTVKFQYAMKGKTEAAGSFAVYSKAGVAGDWVEVSAGPMDPAPTTWQVVNELLQFSEDDEYVRFKFVCAAGSSLDNYCAIDSIRVSCAVE